MSKGKFAKHSRYEQYCMIGIILFVGILGIMGILSLALPKPTESTYEKRELAPMPDFSLAALFTGSFARDYEAHYADTFPWRDGFIQLGVALDDAKGFRGADDVKIYEGTSDQGASGSKADPMGGHGQSGPAGEGSSSASVPDTPPEVPDGYVTEGCFISGDRGCYLFGGYRPVAEQYAQYLTAFADRLDGQARVFNIVVPTSGEFYIPEPYQSMTNSQKDNIDYLYSCLGPSVIPVDAYSWLESHTQEYIYFRTDHHWTALGAYYAYVGYCRTAGLEPVSVSSLEKKTIDSFVGTIYNYTRDSRLSDNPDYVDYYMVDPEATAWLTTKDQPNSRQQVPPYAEFASGGNAYGVFIWADNPLFEMDTTAGTGKTCLVLKESYGNAFSPWLMTNYDKVYVIDYRHYEKSVYDFVLENGVDDVIFINNSFAANTSYHAERINYLCNQL